MIMFDAAPMTRDECAQMVASDPRFHEEPLFVPYYWKQGIDGWADAEGSGPHGYFYEFHPSPEDLAIFPELERFRDRKLRIVRCPVDGSVTAYLKPLTTSKKKKR
jgi:hypothetical protein